MLHIVFFLFCFLYPNIYAANILIVAPMPAYSQFSVAFRIAKDLVNHGHQVTSINAFPRKIPISNYSDVSVTDNIQTFEEAQNRLFSQEGKGFLDNLTALFDVMIALSESTLSNKNVQDLLKSGKTFDVVIVEQFFNDVYAGFSHVFKAPVIFLSSLPASAINNHIFANPAPSSYVAGLGGTLTKNMNFFERLENSLMNSVFHLLMQFYHLPHQRVLYNKYIDAHTQLDTFLYNASLMLTNSHVSVTDAIPHVPSIVEIGGFHIEQKNLSANLQKFLDDSPEGVILFSMGSNLKGKDFTSDVKSQILKAFSKIKQKVLWKFESVLSDVSDNVRIIQWVPQQDVLAHPNVKAFISHGGLLSTIEAVYFGVPIIGIPVFGDQKHNVANAVKNGYALHIPLNELSEEKLLSTLTEVLSNDKYYKNIQKLSRIMHDQPVQPLDLARYWIEYVIRHKGAPHLRSAGLDLSWLQREMIDVTLFLLVIIIVTTITIYLASISLRKLFKFKCGGYVKGSKKRN